MARVTPIEGRRAPLLLRILNRASRRMFGQEATPFKIIAHNPKFLLPFALMSRFSMGRTQLPDEIRRQAIYLTALRNNCPWCLDFSRYHSQKELALAEKLAQIDRYRESSLFSPTERAALAYADEVTTNGGHVRDATFAELRRHFSEREIVELTVAVAAENFYNRINSPLEIEAQGFCALPLAPVHAHA